MLEILLVRLECFIFGHDSYPPFTLGYGDNILRSCRRCHRPTK